MTVNIRKANKTDLSAILDLFLQPDMDGDALELSEAEKLYESIEENPNHHVYVACNDSEIVGTFCILIIPMLSHNGGRMGLLEDVVVRSDQQGKGIGKQMMLFATDECKKLGCYKIMLSSALHRDKTHKFYEGLGFAKHGYSFYL